MLKRASSLLVIFLTGLGVHSASVAQEPFSTIGIQVHATKNINRTYFHEYWKPGRGGGITLTTPFYRGILDMGAIVHRYATTTDVPGFGVTWVHAGLSTDWKLSKALSVRPGLHLGIYRMSFDDAETTFSGVATESDLTMSTGVAMHFAITDQLAVFTRLDYIRVYTEPLLHYWYASSGMAVEFAAGRKWRSLWE